MRILSLEAEGFGPFRARQTIDFTQFDAEGLFVISGRTGAGKSTILDAICFALYDKVPRYEGTDKSVRSDFCGPDEPTTVTLEYELHGQRYRVVRSPAYERTKRRGDGVTTEKATASLYRVGEGEPEPIATMPREVAEHVATTVPLTSDQFLQVILLAQGRFAEFLKADTQERRKLLRSLFGTQRFEDLEARMRERAKEASRKVESADAGLASLAARAAALVGLETPAASDREQFLSVQSDALTEAARLAGETRSAAVDAAESATAALSKARSDEEARVRLNRARDTQAELETDAEAQAEREARLALARRAVPVAGPRRTLLEAEREESSARAALATVLAAAESDPSRALAWPEGHLAEAAPEALDGRASALTAERGSLKDALESERALPRLAAASEACATAVVAAAAAQVATQEGLDALPAQEQSLRADLEIATTAAARADDLEAEVVRATAAVAAHTLVSRLEERAGPIRLREAEAADTSAERHEHHAALVRRRLASQSAHLAEALVDGESCPVCGSLDHPSPAQPTDDHVTDEEVDAAYEAAQAAATALEGARAERVEHDKRIAAAAQSAGEGSAEDAAEALEAAQTARDAALEATAERDRLRAALESLETVRVGLAEELAAHANALTEAREAQTRADAALDAARAHAADRPDGYDSVAAYASALDRAVALLERVGTAMQSAVSSREAVAKAQGALETELAAAGFDSVEAASDAELPRDSLGELEHAVTTHRERLASARAVVAELSDRELPEDAADLDALAATEAAAVLARDAAVEEATASRDRAQQFESLRAEYEELGRSSVAARAERDTIATLADALEGKPPNDRRLRLESFVLASKLERIVAAANARLLVMSSGQYRLALDDSAQYRNKEAGLALSIEDAHTGRTRATQSLSGGETFLASLSLALGLAETVSAEAGGIQLDTLFIDEGFGSLDEETLEVAMATLEDLRDQGRTVGLISHVETMKEAIPAKLDVVKSADGSSRVLSRPRGE
ncbi:AAA family ATPase [Demequina sp. NBRC 110054]|uniref:AAA family ATPase n=1 Tax=Demequina sp. NBRC 110054 TaxID=1570343 RepID=UPI0009FD1FD2|nr:AAA family ATPase [Demequina sp. NBRC 110054]